MSLDKDQVQHIAMLARLKLADDEFADDGRQAVPNRRFRRPAAAGGHRRRRAHGAPAEPAQRLRADAVTEANERDHASRTRRPSSDGLYLVPKVIE